MLQRIFLDAILVALLFTLSQCERAFSGFSMSKNDTKLSTTLWFSKDFYMNLNSDIHNHTKTYMSRCLIRLHWQQKYENPCL